jgi:hypothetical protein
MHTMKQHIEQALHNTSLSLASIYHELENSNDDHPVTMTHIMIAYTSTRRAMEKNHDGKRFGSTEAYRAMTLGEQPNAAPPLTYTRV